ncbi:MAG TPA: NUDIX hydrolase [Solirubrobacteraceae bacterium]|jgi:8-oxo-dGTP pyrophosphatase MutT (NUDIX family)
MPINRPEPGADVIEGRSGVARPAATVIVLRGADARLEVLLVRRHPDARVMGGAWVFPGGSVDPGDGAGQAGLRAAAIRELREEAGITLDADTELLPFMRWITPERRQRRFDTWFFLTNEPTGAAPRIDGSEIVDFRWTSPEAALRAASGGELPLVFPTIKQLERLGRFASAEELLTHARGTAVTAIQPRIVGAGEHARILLPGDRGYED